MLAMNRREFIAGASGLLLPVAADATPIIGFSRAGASGPSFTSFTFSGSVINKNADQSTSGTTDTAMIWQTETRDTDGYHTGSNSTFVVPSALNGKLLMCLAWLRIAYTSTAGEGGRLSIRKNGSDSYDGFGSYMTQGPFATISYLSAFTQPVIVATGDTFEAYVQNSDVLGATVASSVGPNFGIWQVGP
jgi:hypothetical protein